ncbi:MAG TPA: hypothetical protein EYN96_10060, partial [Candidatus Hydrogenedentes bacterium]|nr:hypothetical protein [Candidatus Hydrogenedentota bacterium]
MVDICKSVLRPVSIAYLPRAVPTLILSLVLYLGFVSGAFAGAVALYVDFSNTGPEDGTSPQPFNTLDEALGQATLGQLISLSAFASHETPTITQAVTLTSNGGTATIGDLSSPFGSGSPYEALKITEIMYNPALGKAEYLELQNTSARTIDISGVYFSLGIVYTFPPSTILTAGQYIVLVRDTDEATFISDYPSVSHAGVYTGALNNGGETIALNDPANNVFLTLTYNDSASWPDLADGVGFSLIIIDPHGDGSDSANWRASSSDGGSPGEVDITISIPGIVVNEALTHTDLPTVDTVEFYNPTGAGVDIRGWFISDNRSIPFKAKIPNHAEYIIAAGGYAVIDEDDFFSAPGSVGENALPGFRLSSHGSDIFLFSSDGNDNLTGYAHGWGFDGAENGVSFGREITTDGREHFVAQTSNTFGSSNAGPAVGPLAISELHYNTLSNGVEFIEITNISGSSVNLYDDSSGGDTNNTYKLSGIGFEFPTNQSILSEASVLIVNTDPTDYISRFGDPGIAVYGPFGNDPLATSDALSNLGETVQINWPDTPDEIPASSGIFVAAYISMDKVRYNDKTPWPVLADGTGKSLARLNNTTFGSEPTNWEDSTPSVQPEVQVADVIFSTPRGFYDGTVNLTLSTTTGSAQIRYTTDGTIPTQGSTLYSGTIVMTSGTTGNTPIRANAFLSGYISAPVETHTYIIDAPTYQKGVRAINIVGDPQQSLYNPNGVMAINNGAYFPALFNTLQWGPYTYDTSQPQLDFPGTTDPWFDALGNGIYPLIGATSGTNGATVDGTAYSNPILTGKIMERPASIELLYPDATPGLQENGGVRVAGSDFHRPRYAAHGDGSGDWTVATSTSIPEATLASYLKFSLRMYFRSEYGPSKLTWPIFPGDLLQEYDKLVLRGGHNDGQTPFLKDELTRRLFLDMGRVGVQGTLVNLYINGEYKGWYNPCERLDAKFFQSRFGGSTDYDILIQSADLGGEIGLGYNINNNTPGYEDATYLPQVKEGDDVAFQALIAAAMANEAVPSVPNYDAIAALLDIPQFIDYLLVQLYSGNDDWPNNNWTAARERVVGAKFKFFVWDAEATYLSANINRNGIDHFPFWNPTWQSQGAGLKGEFTP